MVIDFYYWAMQCPYNKVNIDILKSIEKKEKIKVNYYDISGNSELAEKLNLYSPTLTVFDNKIRWTGPLSIKLIENYLLGIIPNRKPYRIEQGSKIVKGEIKYLTSESCSFVKGTCSPSNHQTCCLEKGKWVKEITDKYNLPHLGVIHYLENKCIGGAEFIPSLEVPYKIPKSEDTAFLTCSYLSDTEFDYKSYPLEVLEKELVKMGFKYLLVIASKDVAFPNGPLSCFSNRGYYDLGKLYYEENDDAQQHLLRKELE